jgi:hypothetical protein
MEQLREGIWRWEARHPSWSEDDGGPDGWGPEVASYAVESGGRLLLIDPLAVPADAEQLASGRDTAILLTCPWHERDARALGEGLAVPIYVPPPDDGEQDPTPTSCCGSRTGARSSSATRWSTAARGSRSRSPGSAT